MHLPNKLAGCAAVLLLLGFAVPGRAAPGDTARGATAPSAANAGTEAAERAEAARVERDTATAGKRTAVRDAMRGDPRTRALSGELTAALKIQDKAKRTAALQALAPKVSALRADVLRKAGASQAEIFRKPNVVVPSGAVSAPLGSVISTTTITSFPETFSYRAGCSDGADKFDFDGNKVRVTAFSTPFDKDCDVLRAGRSSAPISIPPGTKRVRVEVTAHVDLYTGASGLGAWAGAWSSFGVRAFLPSGKLWTQELPGGTSVPANLRYASLRQLASDHPSGPEEMVVPADIKAFEDDVQPGDDQSSATITLPDGAGPTIQLGAYVNAKVDADLSGVCSVDSDITLKALKVTFLRD